MPKKCVTLLLCMPVQITMLETFKFVHCIIDELFWALMTM